MDKNGKKKCHYTGQYEWNERMDGSNGERIILVDHHYYHSMTRQRTRDCGSRDDASAQTAGGGHRAQGNCLRGGTHARECPGRLHVQRLQRNTGSVPRAGAIAKIAPTARLRLYI